VPDAGKTHMERLLRCQVTPDDPNTDGDWLARRALITEHPAYRAAFAEALSPRPLHTNEEILALRALDALDAETRAMGEVTGSAGGVGVPVFIDPSIMLSGSQEDADLADFLRISSVRVITTNEWKGVTSDGITWAFATEAAVATDNSPTLVQPTARVHMARGSSPIRSKLRKITRRSPRRSLACLRSATATLWPRNSPLAPARSSPTGFLRCCPRTRTYA
jgi:hypothetical protein